MFDIGFGEMVLLAVIALVAIGPKQLPELARVVGRMINEFRRATGDLSRSFIDTQETTNRLISDARKSMFDASVSRGDAGHDSGSPDPSNAHQAPHPGSEANASLHGPYDHIVTSHDAQGVAGHASASTNTASHAAGLPMEHQPLHAQSESAEEQLSLNLEAPANTVPRKEP